MKERVPAAPFQTTMIFDLNKGMHGVVRWSCRGGNGKRGATRKKKEEEKKKNESLEYESKKGLFLVGKKWG